MAWTFTDLKYGWKIAAGITLAATTIYVASNTRERVNQVDVIELVLGVTERCLATQYATNPVSYYVAPPSFVRSWYSNSYETTNVPGDLVTNWYAVLHTNAFTNVIGWRTDRAMMVELDAKIKALVPYYCNTDTVYDGSTNIVMLTVTGLWASLGIGDGTNQFTSVPASGTNAATYGALPWRIYKKDLEERYKVLNALKMTRPKLQWSGEFYYSYYITAWDGGQVHGDSWGGADAGWDQDVIKPLVEAHYGWYGSFTNTISSFGKYSASYYAYGTPYVNLNSWATLYSQSVRVNDKSQSTNVSATWFVYLLPDKAPFSGGGGYLPYTNINTFDDYGTGWVTGIYNYVESGPVNAGSILSSTFLTTTIPDWPTVAETRFYSLQVGCMVSPVTILDWNFQYCTHKFW
jgi:hypothetical protein